MSAPKLTSPVLDFLRTTCVWDVTTERERKLVTVPENATVQDTLKTLYNHEISSAPVLDEDGDPLGVIDTLDLVTYAAAKLDPELTGKELDQIRLEDFLEKAPILNLMDFSQRNAWHSIPATKSLKKAMHFLSHPNMHRVFLTGRDGNPIAVLTQSRMVQFLLKHQDLLKDRFKMTVRELFPEERPVVCVSEESNLLEAFKTIMRSGVTGVGVVNKKGELIGCVSAADLKYARFSNLIGFFRTLREPLRDFLAMRDKRTALFGPHEPHFAPITVTYDDTLEKVMQTAAEERVHRVFIVNKENKPVRSISLGDMIAQFNF